MIRNSIYIATHEMYIERVWAGIEKRGEQKSLCVCVRFSKTRPHFQHIASNCFLIEQIVDTGSNTQRSHV